MVEMKGITPVVAIILLLLITVSLVGFAFTWFTRITTTSAEKISNRTEKLLGAKSILLENAKGTVIDLRNTGNAAIPGNEFQFYVNDVKVQSSCPVSLAPGAIGTCNLVSPAFCSPSDRLRATVLGAGDIITCK